MPGRGLAIWNRTTRYLRMCPVRARAQPANSVAPSDRSPEPSGRRWSGVRSGFWSVRYRPADRADWWDDRKLVVRRALDGNPIVIKVKHQPDPGGRQEGQAPRFPVFVAVRDLEVD